MSPTSFFFVSLVEFVPADLSSSLFIALPSKYTYFPILWKSVRHVVALKPFGRCSAAEVLSMYSMTVPSSSNSRSLETALFLSVALSDSRPLGMIESFFEAALT